jgi:Lysylphosphatidylglycerol synthase TM region
MRAEPAVQRSSRTIDVRRLAHPAAAAALTAAIFALLMRRVPFAALVGALSAADYGLFLAIMVPNTFFYFAWDTLVLAVVVGWCHGAVSYRDLLPIRAASYVVGFFNTNVGRGVLAAYLSRHLRAPFVELGSTVIFLVVTEYTQLVLWSMLGLLAFRPDVSRSLLLTAGGVALFWLAVRWLLAPRHWSLARTFRLATPARYAQVVALRAPMFVVSLCAHYYAARAFGLHIPFGQMLVFLPVIFMLAALPITVGHLGTTQAAWVFFFSQYAAAPQLLAFSLAAHLVFASTRAILGIAWLPAVYFELVPPMETLRRGAENMR